MHIEPTQPVGGGSPREDCSTTPLAVVGSCMEGIMERWRPVVGCEGLYEVSDHGQVRSLRPKGVPLILKPFFSEKKKSVRYLKVSLSGNRPRICRVHRLVLAAFHGPCPVGSEGAHLDGHSTNNNSANLAWVTRSENHLMKRTHGTGHAGEKNPQAKLTWEQADDARARVGAGETTVSVAKDFGVHPATVYLIVKGRTWKPELRPTQGSHNA